MDKYEVVIHYHSGKKEGQIIIIKVIDDHDIMEVLGEITQDQLSNADITVADGHSHLNYEGFIIERNTNILTTNSKKS